MNNQTKALLLELLTLRVRYGDREFEQAAKALKKRNDEFLTNILTLLREFSPEKRKPEDAEVAVIHNVEPTKEDLIQTCAHLLQSKEAFRTVKDLQAYVSPKIKLTGAKYTKKELVKKFTAYLSDLPAKAIANETDELRERILKGEESSSFINMANAIVSSRKEKRY